jgi:hypothetical protein
MLIFLEDCQGNLSKKECLGFGNLLKKSSAQLKIISRIGFLI